VLKRIDALTHRSLETLSVASVIGKHFEFDLLLKLSRGRAQARPYSSDEMLDILDEGVQFQLIREQFDMPNVYSFTHDKIIEALYNRLLLETRTQLHGQIGETLEADHPEPMGAVIYELAHHFSQSADKEKALDYSIRAGDLAKAAYANAEAIAFYERALQLMPPEMQTGESQTWLRVVENLADVYSLAGHFEKAVANYEELRPHFQEFDLPRLETKVTSCFTTVYRFSESLEHCEKALVTIGKKTPRTSFGWTVSLLAQICVQIAHNLFPFLIRKNPQAQELVKIYMSVSWLYAYSSDLKKTMRYALKAFNEADRAYNSVERVSAYAGFYIVYAGYGMRKLSQKMDRKVRVVVERVNNPIATAIYEAHAGMADYYLGDYDSAIQHSLKAIEIYHRIGDVFHADLSCTFLGWAYSVKGDLENALRYYKLGAEIMEQTGGLKERHLASVGWIYGYQGELDEGIDLMRQSLPSVESNRAPLWLIQNYRNLGELHAMKGDWEESIGWMEKSLRLIKEAHALPRLCCPTYTFLAESLLGDRAKIEGMSPREKKAHFKRVDKLCQKGIRAGADLVRGQAYRVEGIRWRLAGNPKKAMGYFQKSIEVLTRKGMKLQLALTYYEAGKWLSEDGDAQTQEYLEKAAGLFEETGAALYHPAKAGRPGFFSRQWTPDFSRGTHPAKARRPGFFG